MIGCCFFHASEHVCLLNGLVNYCAFNVTIAVTGLESIVSLFGFSLSSLFLPSVGLAKYFKNYLILSLLLAFKQNKLHYAFLWLLSQL